MAPIRRPRGRRTSSLSSGRGGSRHSRTGANELNGQGNRVDNLPGNADQSGLEPEVEVLAEVRREERVIETIDLTATTSNVEYDYVQLITGSIAVIIDLFSRGMIFSNRVDFYRWDGRGNKVWLCATCPRREGRHPTMDWPFVPPIYCPTCSRLWNRLYCVGFSAL